MKVVVSTGRIYHGRYTWDFWGCRKDAAKVGYCFVNGKGRDYLRNYRLIWEHAMRTGLPAGVRLICFPFKKSEDPRKKVFAERFLRPLVVYQETPTHIFYTKAL